MTLRLLIDEDSQGRILVSKLRSDGHDVLTVGEAGLRGEDDRTVFQVAQECERATLTHNCRDFLTLAAEHTGQHFGILLVYQENDPLRDMSADEIVNAISNLERTGIDLRGQTIALNHYRY